MAAWVAPAAGSLPQSTDVGQIVQGLTAVADVGVLSLAAPVSAPATAPTLGTSTSGTAINNTEWGVVTFVTGVVSASGQLSVAGETPAGPVSSAVAVANAAIAWSALPTGPSTVVARRLYRSPAIPNPATALSLTQAAGSTGFTAGETVYVAYALSNSAGTTTPGSSQASINIATAGNTIGTSVTLPSTASGIWLYVGTASGPLALAQVDSAGTITYSGGVTAGLAVSVSGSTLTLTISAVASSTGASPATANTANTGVYGLVATIPNNSQTTWIDNVADSALGTAAPTINTTGSGLAFPLLAANPPNPVAGQVAIHDSSTLGGYVAEVWTGTAWQNVAGPDVAFTDLPQTWTAPQGLAATGPSGSSTDNYGSYAWDWNYVASGTAGTVVESVDQFGDWTLSVGGSPVAQVSTTGALITVGGQSTVGPVGVGAVVGVTEAQVVTSTAQTRILTVAVPVTGLYWVAGYVRINNGTSGNAITFATGWTDPDAGTVGTAYFNLGNQVADAGPSFANGLWSGLPVLVYAEGGTSIIVNYTDPTNTPNDTVSAVVVRLT